MTPPRPLRTLLGRLAPAACRETFLDDMDELFARRAADAGTPRAIAWYCRQLVARVWRLRAQSLRRESASYRARSRTLG
jgi:hypothetical protein